MCVYVCVNLCVHLCISTLLFICPCPIFNFGDHLRFSMFFTIKLVNSPIEL
jgi:hypothetical protein